MTAGTHNITIEVGADFRKSILLEQPAGTPVNLTGYTARMMIRSNYADANPLISLTSSSGITLGGTAGTMEISIPAATTAALSAGLAAYDLELTDTLTKKIRLLQGSVTISPAVTR